MDARQPAELPRPADYVEAAWNDLVKHLEHEFADRRGTDPTPPSANETNTVDRILQCLMDSYRALFGLW
ncbi:hypothetical protein [Amycolatopsis vancoresmycina]|uniref:hypothetical protein n=1 Tax=Amycolatopsis vancoresmycina TaxID=208444 RepID=UPI0012DF08EB|nr:hypothetical protein [Amycolatopsis vancoresmycina]